MKMMLKKLNAVKLRAFTLIEMLVVLLIISILLLLFVPNLSKQKDSVKETGNAAVVKVVDSQAELYEMKNNKTASLAALVSEGQITQNRQIHTMITMRNMVAKAAQWPIRAFTLLESLVTLAVVAFLTLSLSGSVTGIFQQVETNLFYLRFEYLYRDSQRLAAAEGSNVELQLAKDKISNGKSSLVIPKNIHLDKGQTLVFDAKGGNSSLTKIRFSSDKEVVTYQLNMGSGKYKKTVS